MDNTLREYTREGLLEIINALPLAVLVIDKDRAVTLANKVSLEFTAKDMDTLIGLVAGEAFSCVNHEKDSRGCGFSPDCARCRFKEALADTLTNRTPHFMIETTKTILGRGERILRFSTKPLKLAGKQVALMSIQDLTEERNMERIRLEREKLAAVLETTGGVCHELSQPLQVIMGYCEILEEKNGLDKETSNALIAIHDEVKKLARLTHDLTSITRYETKPYLTSKILDIEKSSLKDN
ncbi:MAG: PAS domain-containing protein [Desulfobacterales bacterium]|nr:PAS domain-containing protein [Desulfobacterales bacterium]